MNTKNYFEKNGFIYGISEKYEFGGWNGYFTKFDNLEDAKKWLNTEEGNFHERELTSKTKALKTSYDFIDYAEIKFYENSKR